MQVWQLEAQAKCESYDTSAEGAIRVGASAAGGDTVLGVFGGTVDHFFVA